MQTNKLNYLTVTYLGEPSLDRDFSITNDLQRAGKDMGVSFQVQEHDYTEEFAERTISYSISRELSEEEKMYLYSHFEDMFTQIYFGNFIKLF